MDASSATHTHPTTDTFPLAVLAFDIEKVSPVVFKGLIAVGASLRTIDGTEVEKRLWCFKWDSAEEDADTMKWWATNQEQLDKIREIAENSPCIEKSILEIIEYVERCYETYPNLEIMSDTPAFDLGTLSYYMSLYAGKTINSLNKSKPYSPITDMHSWMLGVLDGMFPLWRNDMNGKPGKTSSIVSEMASKYPVFFKNPPTSHDHMPDNDASHRSWLYCQTVASIREHGIYGDYVSYSTQ
jgi:hypothetical protein